MSKMPKPDWWKKRRQPWGMGLLSGISDRDMEYARSHLSPERGGGPYAHRSYAPDHFGYAGPIGATSGLSDRDMAYAHAAQGGVSPFGMTSGISARDMEYARRMAPGGYGVFGQLSDRDMEYLLSLIGRVRARQ